MLSTAIMSTDANGYIEKLNSIKVGIVESKSTGIGTFDVYK